MAGPEDLLLIKAAVDPPNIAIQHWNRWNERYGKASLHHESRKLLPQIFHNLFGAVVDTNGLGVLVSAFQKTALRNGKLWKAFGTVAEELNRLGHVPVVFKGGSLALRYYALRNMRHLGDLDVFLTSPDNDVRGCMKKLGYRDKYFFSERYSPRIFHAAQYAGADGGNIDIHRFLLHEHLYAAANELLLENATTHQLENGAAIRLLSAESQLFLAIVHGTRGRSSKPALLWITDAAKIIRSAAVDWQRVSFLVSRFRYESVFAQALPFLRDEIGLDIPQDAIDRVAIIRQPAKLGVYLAARDKIVGEQGVRRISKSFRNCVLTYRYFLKGNVNYSFAAWLLMNYAYRLERRRNR